MGGAALVGEGSAELAARVVVEALLGDLPCAGLVVSTVTAGTWRQPAHVHLACSTCNQRGEVCGGGNGGGVGRVRRLSGRMLLMNVFTLPIFLPSHVDGYIYSLI